MPIPQSRILVVDDRPENLMAIEAVLEPLKTKVVSVTSGAEALRRLLREDYAVVLLDVEMPEMDGIETAELIRTRPRSAHLPIIFITATGRDMDRIRRGYALGAIDYLQKPLDPDILRAKVGFFVELHEQGDLILRQERELTERRRADEEARRAAELEKQLVGMVGHDIRSPLSAILATAQVQLRRGALPEEQRRALERIERSSQRIREIVELLLDFTRARVGHGIPLALAPCSLPEVCRRVAEEFVAIHPDRRIEYQCDVPGLTGHWDGSRLGQVLANLLDNALKYGEPGRPVKVSLREGEGDAVIEVHNEGNPIPAHKLGTLFEPYVRAEDQGQHEKTSLGLGLFIVREIVRGHRGEVEVDSTAEAGTTFRIVLPRGLVRRELGAPAAASAQA